MKRKDTAFFEKNFIVIYVFQAEVKYFRMSRILLWNGSLFKELHLTENDFIAMTEKEMTLRIGQ